MQEIAFYIGRMIKLMQQQSQNFDEGLSKTNHGNSFIKGMSLEQYMSKKAVNCKEMEEDEKDTKENLYESSGNQEMAGLMSKNIEYCINQIDEQSVEESSQSNIEQSFHIQNEEKPRNVPAPFHDLKTHLPTKDWKFKVSNIAMNATSYFKNDKEERNSFRVKRMSMSPSKKFDKNLANGSITIYGSKFGQTVQKKTVNMPEIVTFYGKLSNIESQKMNDLISSKDKFKKKDARNHGRKNQLNLNELLECESRIKMNRASHNHLQEIKINNKMTKANEKISQIY